MRKRLYLLPGLLAFFLAPGATAQTSLTNVPGTVVAPNYPLNLSGDFVIGTPIGSEPSIISNGTGGACLVAQPVTPESCDVSCNPEGKFAEAYCIKDDLIIKGRRVLRSSGTCWVKPFDTSDDTDPQSGAMRTNPPCLMKVGVGPHDTPVFDGTSFLKHNKGITKWRVYTCLNGPSPSCYDPYNQYVEGITKLHRAGAIFEFQKTEIKPLGLRYPIWIYISIALAALALGLAVYFRRRGRAL